MKPDLSTRTRTTVEGRAAPRGERADPTSRSSRFERPADRAAPAAKPAISVVVPVLHAAVDPTRVLEGLPEDLHEILLVDAAPTTAVADRALALRPDLTVVRANLLESAEALAGGLHSARGDIVVVLAADGSADPGQIPAFVQALQEGADYVKGSRFLPGAAGAHLGAQGRAANRILSGLVNALYGTSYTDVSNGSVAFWSYCLPRLDLDGGATDVQTLLNLRAARAGLRVTEVACPRAEAADSSAPDSARIVGTLVRERFRRPGDDATEPGAGVAPPPAPSARSHTRSSEAPGALTAEPTRRARSRRRRSSLALGIADALAAAVAVGAALAVDGGQLDATSYLGVLLVLVLARIMGLHGDDGVRLRKSTLDEAPLLLQLAAATSFLGWWAAVLGGAQLGAAVPAVFFGTLLAALLLFRRVARGLSGRVSPLERCLLIGDDLDAHTLRGKLDGHNVPATVVAQVALAELKADRGRAAAPTGRVLQHLVVGHDINRLVVSSRTAEAKEAIDLLREARALGLAVSILPGLGAVLGSTTRFESVGGMTLMAVRTDGMRRSTRRAKRAFDVAGSALGLFALAPVFAGLAVIIRLGSPGPILFRQPRIGRDGEPFEMLKFRTMVDGADEMKAELAEAVAAGELFKLPEDPRVTNVGRILRRAGLDELPQLVNVLRGEMSLVGPRPLIAEEDQRIQGWDRDRLRLTPGMTGQWQISGPMRPPLREMVTIDYLYVTNWSLWTDIKILLRTAAHVCGRRGQ
jgi:exopolysaccharide biosynthesis polyprenyl glycosylphosphotransferase